LGSSSARVRFTAALALAATVLVSLVPAVSADNGLQITTPYPAVAVAPGSKVSFDLTVSSVRTADIALSLGGVQASSSVIPKNAFSLGDAQYTLGGGSNGGGASFDLPGDTGGTGDTSYTGTAPDTSTGGGAGGDSGNAPSGAKRLVTQPASALVGKRGGGLAVAGLASLGLLGALAEGDRRKMRRAQREIPDTQE